MKRNLLIAIAALSAVTLSARQLTPDEALARLSGDAGARRGAPAVSGVGKTPRLVKTAKAGDAERVYLFAGADDRGFMVLSADDRVPALLAYSDSETIDADNMPSNLQYWLDEYARQIAWAEENNVVMADAAEATTRAEVAPKLTTKWDQVDPYNGMTPMHNGLPTPTGCVATAVAQIMKWHEWPVRGNGVKTFSSYYVGTLGMDFGAYEFEWDLMPDQLLTTSPQECKDAVSYLMKAAGYASEMVYHQKASGATGYHAAEGLFTHLGYSKAMTLERHEWYEIDEWEDLVYAELTENGPVYFEGDGDGGGHAFVCDGYQASTGLFHFNWGWSGRGDGYYRLTALNPNYVGTGGYESGYNYSQDIIRGLKKAPEGVAEEAVLIFSPGKGVITPWETCTLGQRITIKGYDTSDGFVNRSIVPVPEVEFGVRLRNVNNGEVMDVKSDTDPYDFDHYSKVNIISFYFPAEIAEGEYVMQPIWRTKRGEWREMRYSPQTCNYVPVTVKDGNAELGLGVAEGRVEGKLTHAPAYFTTSGEFTVKGTLKNVGTRSFTGLVCAVFFKFDAKNQPVVIDQGDAERVDVRVGQTLEYEYTSTPQNGRLTDGDDYYISLGNANTGEILTPLYAVRVGNKYGKLQMSTTEFSIAGSNYLDPSNVRVTTSVKVVAGMYDGPIAVGYFVKKTAEEPERLTISKTDFHLEAGDDKTITFDGILNHVEEGDVYYAHIMYKNADDKWVRLSLAPVTVVVGADYSVEETDPEAGVDTVAGDAVSVSVYNLSGIPVGSDLSGLAPGVYIVRTTDASGRTTVTKVIR